MAAIDVDTVTTEIAAQIPALVSVGIAVLLITVAIYAFRWVRAVLNEGSGQDWGDTFDDQTYTQDDYDRDTK